MSQKLSVPLVLLIHDACLKAFWTHKALHQFLRLNDVPVDFINRIEGETKKDFLERLFNDLRERLTDNKGHAIILKIGRSLSEMDQFPDLANYEDSQEKIKTAKSAISTLKPEIDKINKKTESKTQSKINREKEQERLKKIQEKQLSFKTLSNRLDQMVSDIGTQKAGYDFEKWFYDLAIFQEIQAKRSYKDCNDRQIDGSITIDGTTFLIETKFIKEPVNVNAIDHFFAKIERKADNTMGIFIAISGFDDSAKKAASKDRTTMLLMDGPHLYNLILAGRMTLSEVVRRIKRHASQTGEAYLETKNF